MILLFFASVICVMSFQLFMLNYQIQGLNRAVVFTPVEILYKGVSSHESIPYFTSRELITYLDDYYEKTLTRYVNEYEVSYYFYNQEDESMCIEDYCDAIEITVDCSLTFNHTFHRVMFYEIRSNNG